jgi:type IV fimbrial biogenesis protein FimT
MLHNAAVTTAGDTPACASSPIQPAPLPSVAPCPTTGLPRRAETVSRDDHHARGFSFPESLAVLAVAGIAASMAAPAYRGLVSADRQATAANELVGTLLAARSAALTRNLPVVVCASPDGHACDGRAWERGWMAFTDANDDGRPDADDVVIATAQAHAGLAIRSGEFSPSLTYRPNGAVRGTAGDTSGEFSICLPGAGEPGRLVAVLPAGEPRVVAELPGGVKPACAPENAS